jgi:hypothetical protein
MEVGMGALLSDAHALARRVDAEGSKQAQTFANALVAALAVQTFDSALSEGQDAIEAFGALTRLMNGSDVDVEDVTGEPAEVEVPADFTPEDVTGPAEYTVEITPEFAGRLSGAISEDEAAFAAAKRDRQNRLRRERRAAKRNRDKAQGETGAGDV